MTCSLSGSVYNRFSQAYLLLLIGPNRRQFCEKTASPPFGHRDQAVEVEPVLPMLPDRYRIWR
jgi:hypothetical protein